MEEDNEIPEEYQPKGLSLTTIIVAAIILIVLIIVWAVATGRIP